MGRSSGRFWFFAGLFCGSLAYDDRIPASWTSYGGAIELQTALTSSPWYETHIYGQSPRTSSLAAAVSRCWSSSGKQLSEDYCLRQALDVAFICALTDLGPGHNTTKIGGRDLRSAPSPGASQLDEFDVVDLELEGDAFRPRQNKDIHARHVQANDVPASIKYTGALRRAFLYRRKVGNHSLEAGADRPIFVATDGEQKEIAHLQSVEVTSRDDSAESTGLIYEAGGGIKIQSQSQPVTIHQYVRDWMNSNSGADDSGTASMSDYLMFVAKKVGYLAFELVDGEPGKNGKFIMLAESLGFGTDWESNWNWCFTSDDTVDCRS